MNPQAKREVVQVLRREHHLSERRTCQAVGLSRSVYRYQADTKPDQPIVEVLLEADFMSDALGCGRRFRTFNVVDDFNRD